MYLPSNHLRIVVLKQRENLIGSNPQLSLRHVLQISHLNDGIHPTRLKLQEVDTPLKHLNSPPQKLFQLLFVPKNPLIYVLVFEHPISIVTHRMSISVLRVHVSDHPFKLFEPQILFTDGISPKLLPPFQAFLEHHKRVRNSEVSGSEEFEENDIGSIVSLEERNTPHGGVRVDCRGKLGFDLLKGLFLGGLELGDEVGVFPEGRGAEGDDVHERGDKALVEWFGGWGLWGFLS